MLMLLMVLFVCAGSTMYDADMPQHPHPHPHPHPANKSTPVLGAFDNSTHIQANSEL
jgi:hypothetical protein